MPGIQRLTDANNLGGSITLTAANVTVFANTLLVSIDGSIGTSHPPSNCGSNPNGSHCIGIWTTFNGCPTVFAHGVPVNMTGNIDTCSHSRVGGSTNVFLCAGGAGAIADHNPPMNPFGGIGGGTLPLPPANANSAQHPENYTVADVHAHTLNDDPDDSNTITASAPANTTLRPVQTLATDTTTPPTNVPIISTCPLIDALPANFEWSTFYGSPSPPNFESWANDPGNYPEVQLSANFTVADLTIFTTVSRYEFTTSVTQASGLTQKEILQNLCYLANTVLEPMLLAYGGGSPIKNMVITSAFRQQSGGSQHAKGQAADIQFFDLHGLSNTKDLYFSRAQNIRDNIVYDQLILEWFGRNPWIHISTNSTGLRNNVLTQITTNTYSSGLLKIG